MKGFKRVIVLTFSILFSCEGVLLEEDIRDKEIELIAPSDTSELESKSSYNFYWEKLDVKTDYQIQIASPNFENPIEIVLDSAVSNHFVDLAIEAGVYQWRVRAKNDAYFSEYSNVFNLIIKESGDTSTEDVDISGNIVSLIAPSNDSELDTKSSYSFYWEELTGATTYQIQITKSDFDTVADIVVDSEITDHQLDVTIDAGTYQWRVRAKNESYTTAYSTPFSVVIK